MILSLLFPPYISLLRHGRPYYIIELDLIHFGPRGVCQKCLNPVK